MVMTSVKSPEYYLGEAIELFNAFCDEIDANGGQVSRRFMDAVGLPEGALQRIMPPIRQIFPETWAVNYIPMNALSAPGADKLTYPRLTEYGTSRRGATGTNNWHKVDIGIQNIDYAIKHDQVYFDISNHELNQLAHAQQTRNYVTSINLLAEKQRVAEQSGARLRDTFLFHGGGRGDRQAGFHGFLNSPDIPRIILDEAFPSATPSENIRVLSKAVSKVSEQTAGTFYPTTIVFPPADLTYLKNQERSASASDKSTLGWFQSNQGTVDFDGGRRPFECDKSAQLENALGTGKHAFIVLTRRLDCLEQCVPMGLTTGAIVPKKGGYEVPMEADYAALLMKQPYSAVIVEYSR